MGYQPRIERNVLRSDRNRCLHNLGRAGSTPYIPSRSRRALPTLWRKIICSLSGIISMGRCADGNLFQAKRQAHRATYSRRRLCWMESASRMKDEIPDRPCAKCKKVFSPDRTKQVYCRDCFKIYYRKYRADGRDSRRPLQVTPSVWAWPPKG